MRPTLALAALLLTAALAPLPASGQGWCSVQTVHTYVAGGSANLLVDNVAETRALGAVVVQDTNASDCNTDGFPFDSDGDWETGFGGGFFPYSHHTPRGVCVNDFVWGGGVAFVIGFDGNGNGVIFPDMENTDLIEGPFLGCGGLMWWPDGCAHRPANGDPNLRVEGLPSPALPRPADDPSAMGHCVDVTGEDGVPGFWVYLQGESIVWDGASFTLSNPPTMGTITTT